MHDITRYFPAALITAGLALGVATSQALAGTHEVSSPTNKAKVTLASDGGKLRYTVEWNGRRLVAPSAIAVCEAPVSGLTVGKATQVDKTWRPVWGQWSEIRDHCRELRLELKMEGGLVATLVCRAYDDGVAFRFILPAQAGRPADKLNFRCEHRLDPSARLWWPSPMNRLVPAGPLEISEIGGKRDTPNTPVVVDSGAAGFAAILESDLYSAPAFESMRIRTSADAPATLVSESTALAGVGETLTPWRVILLGNNPADLLMSTATLNLAAPCKLPDPSWIKPGKAVWDWRVHGYRAPDGFVYGINTASYKRFIEFATRNNIQYLLIDEFWFSKAAPGRLTVAEQLDIAEVMRFAKEKGVDVLLYYHRRQGNFGDAALFADYAGRGAVGVKYGFMGDKAAFTRAAIDAAAANRLLIDFHDGPCPMTGVERTMPNLVTREYCHSQQDSRRAFSSESFLKMAAINALVGPLDQNNGNYALDNINSGQRKFGPRSKNSYFSTVVSETARVLIINSGLICLPDAPEEYAKKADLFEFIRQMPPATWDDTRVLNCRIGESITTARRSGKQWFIGSVTTSQGGELTVPLDFLDKDTEYLATFYEDALPAQNPPNQEAYRVRNGTVRRSDVVKAQLAPNGGHCIWIRPPIK